MRTFIAVEIDQHVKDELKYLIEQLKDNIDARSGEMKWVKPDAVHLTLKFLGDVADKDVLEVCDTAERVAQKYEHFHVELESVGSFGNPPRVIWVGIKDEDKILTQMANELDAELFKLGFDMEGRKFKPHLTLCRIKSLHAGRNAREVLGDFEDYEGPELPVESVCIFHSKLTEKGAEHTVMSRTELK